VLQAKAVTRTVLDNAARHALEAGFDHVDGVGRRQQLADLFLCQIQGHEPDFLMKLI
jgi:hypothetical protein